MSVAEPQQKFRRAVRRDLPHGKRRGAGRQLRPQPGNESDWQRRPGRRSDLTPAGVVRPQHPRGVRRLRAPGSELLLKFAQAEIGEGAWHAAQPRRENHECQALLH